MMGWRSGLLKHPLYVLGAGIVLATLTGYRAYEAFNSGKGLEGWILSLSTPMEFILAILLFLTARDKRRANSSK
jgi:hypothetical protein